MSRDIKKLIDELKRRRVFRVAAVYSGFAFIVFQIIDATFDTLGIPQWLGKYSIIALALGFPIAVGLGWAFDITDKGVIRTKNKPIEHDSRKPFVGNRSLSIVAAIAVIMAIWGWIDTPEVRAEGYQSIAVLPFDNYMGDTSQDYFVDGMTEAIIAQLARLEGLRVISRTSVMRFRGSEKSLTEIADELGVDAIVEGSVLKAGNEVRITAQLIDGLSDEHLWANSFEKQLDQVLSLQRNVASAIAEQIKWTFEPEDETHFAEEEKPVDSDAYELYLKGWSLRILETNTSLERAMNYFDAALILDSSLYQAHAAKVVTLFLNNDRIQSQGEALEAVSRAVELAPDKSESWMAQAIYHQFFDINISKAQKAFEKVIDARPGDAESRREYGLFLMRLGLHEEAINQLEKSRAYDPLSALCLRDLGQLYIRAGQAQKGMDLINASLGLDPENEQAEAYKGMALLAVNKPMLAYEHYEYLSNKFRWYHIGLPLAMIRSGHSEPLFNRMDSLKQQSDETNYFLKAVTSAALGDIDEAITAFENMAVRDPNGVMFINEEPLWDPIRHRPEYKKVLREFGFPEQQPESFSDMLNRLHGFHIE